jgi:hypothetical protein
MALKWKRMRRKGREIEGRMCAVPVKSRRIRQAAAQS